VQHLPVAIARSVRRAVDSHWEWVAAHAGRRAAFNVLHGVGSGQASRRRPRRALTVKYTLQPSCEQKSSISTQRSHGRQPPRNPMRFCSSRTNGGQGTARPLFEGTEYVTRSAREPPTRRIKGESARIAERSSGWLKSAVSTEAFSQTPQS